MYDADLPPDGVLAVLGVVDEIVVVLVTGRDIALVVMCKQDIVALVGDLAELELLIELDGVEQLDMNVRLERQTGLVGLGLPFF
nr:hypothetical protein [uncultured Ruminococcus sp.]